MALDSWVTGGQVDDAGTVTIHLIAGHAFVEIAPSYLLWVGAEAEVRGLDDADRLALVSQAMGRLAARGLIIPTGHLAIPLSQTVH